MPKPTDAKKVLEMLYGAPKPAVSRLDMGFKDVTKRMPELQQAAKLYEQGKITREQYYAIVDQLKPVTPYEFIPKPATAEEALAALTSDKVKDFGRTDVLTPGETILSRLDIPAYSKKGTWVTSQHRLKPPADEPKTIYTPTMMLEGETKMLPGTKAARKVAKGEENKSSFATIRGAYKPGSDEEAVERAIEALRSKDYAQIGYDPERRGFFYDRKTMEPIIGTEEGIIQIGPLVLGKKPIRGNPEDFEYKEGGAVHMQDGGDPTQMFNFNPMAAKAAKQKQMRESTPETPIGALSRGFATGLFGSAEEQVPYTGSIMEGSPQRQQSQANLREIGRNVGALTDIGGMVTPFAKPATQAITRGATALGRTGLEQVDRAMFGEGPLGNALSMVAPLNVNAPVSKLGFYNPIEEMATTLQRKQGPGQAFLNEFTRAGISKQRLEDAGLAQKLAAAPNVTREEVQAMTKGTMPDVEEVVLSRSVVPPYMKGFANLHMPDLNVNDYRQINQLRKLADERYQKALAENDLDAAEFAMKAEEDINKFSRTHSYGTKPGERLTEYHDYQEPGGKNYREVLLKVPSSEKYDDNFRSSHWSDPNVISHIRMNDRVDADNKNVLFIEELQSDWAQEGRKKGFTPKDFDKQISEGEKRLEQLRDQLAVIKNKLDQPGLAPDERNSLMGEFIRLETKQMEEIDWGNRLYDARSSAIPEGPFVKNTNEWVDLSLKNIIRRAVDEGYDRVAFIDGYKSFLRFPQGADGESTEAGMRKFYDEIIPGRLKALVGKDNVRTIPGITQQRPLDVSLQGDRYYVVDADTDIAIPDHPGFRSLERAEQYLDELYSKSKSMDQIGFDITPEIREKFSKPIPYKEGGAVKRVHISDNPDTMLLELTRAPRMQEGGKPPPGIRRAMAQQRGTVAPIPGIKTPAEFIGGYVGADPRFSVMDSDADALERAYRAGEATSVIGDIVGSISPFATASTLARANALPGAAVVKAGAKKQPNVMAEFEKALAKSGPPTPAQIKKADAAEERVKKEKKFAKLRPSEQRQAIEAARSEALGTTVDRSSKVLKALLPGEEDIMTSLQGIKGYEVAKAVPAYAVKEAKVKRAKLREEPPTTPGANASEKEWQDWGKQFGVDMTLSKPVSLGISDPVAKREVKIPGGLEGTFTIPDMFWMKANNVNPAALPKDVHDKLMLKFIRTHTVAEPDEVDIFNRLNFALLSPNAPLTSNEFLAMRARIRDKDELERLAARSGEEGLSKKMAEELGVQSGAKGGMGVLGTADLANQAELARMILQKPEMFMIQPGETMRDVTMRVMNQVPGLGPKTASLATPWLDLKRANTSAVDLHMIRDATPRLLTDPDVGAAFRARMGKLLGVEPTMEAILAQPANKIQEKAVQIVGGSDVSKVYRTKTGALNEIPEAALPEKLVYEPSALSNFNPFYSKVVEYVDESRGANPVLELFPEQWRKWDVIRERIEPHEFAHPDYRKLPKQSFSEMKAASDEHTAAGYRGQRPVMDETDWRKLYYGSLAPLGVGLGAGALSEMDTGTD